MQNWNKLNVKYQVLIIFAGILLAVLTLIFIYFTFNQRQFYEEQLQQELYHKAELINDNEKTDFELYSLAEIDRWADKFGERIDSRITIIRADGEVIADSHDNPSRMDNHARRTEIRMITEADEIGQVTRYSNTLEKDMFYLALPREENGEITGYIRVSRSIVDVQQALWTHTRNYFIFVLVLFVVTFLIIVKFSNRIVIPIIQITRLAEKISRGEYEERVTLNFHSQETGRLADIFNHMADKLQEKIRELSEEKNRVETILDNMLDGIVVTDKNRHIKTINPAAGKMLSLRQDSCINRDLIQVTKNYQLDEALENSIEKNKVIFREINIKKSKGDKILFCQFAPVTENNNGIQGAIIVLTDITELRKLEQVRKDFVANVSHELRTPLTSIIGYLDTILESEIEDEKTVDHFLQIIKQEADRLKLLIDDLFELTEVEDSKLILRPADLLSSVEEVIQVLTGKAEEKNIKLTVNCQKESLPRVMMAPERIEQVMTNLIDNAIKYTSEGGNVKINLYQKRDKIYIEVEDNGIGIPEKDQERIFERFYRVDKARSREIGGTGIGLSIVKHIIQGHDSDIEVESQSGQGTVFRFYLETV